MAFPSREDAPKIAARLRKFGIKVDSKHVVIPDNETPRVELLQPAQA